MFQALIDRFVQWCYYSPSYGFIRDTRYGVPFIQSMHLTGITLLLGSTLALNLRMLGFGFRRMTLPYLAEQLWGWTKTGMVLTIVSGIMVFLPDPTRYAHNNPFRLKMVLLCLALAYQFAVFRGAIRLDPESRPRSRTVLLSVLSLCLWFGVAWAGRAIAFF